MSEKMIQEYELSQEMAWSIKRVQEKLALEEFPAYTLLEQFAYLLCIRMQNRRDWSGNWTFSDAGQALQQEQRTKLCI